MKKKKTNFIETVCENFLCFIIQIMDWTYSQVFYIQIECISEAKKTLKIVLAIRNDFEQMFALICHQIGLKYSPSSITLGISLKIEIILNCLFVVMSKLDNNIDIFLSLLINYVCVRLNH